MTPINALYSYTPSDGYGDATTADVLGEMNALYSGPGGSLRSLRNAIPESPNTLSAMNMLRSGLGTAANWMQGRPEIGPDTLAPLGLAGVGTLMAPRNALGIFGGRMAATADQNALATAEKMAASGAPREDIWKQTGWFQGVDGKWRFEIDDSGTRVLKFDDEFASAGRPMPSDLAWKHDDLFKAYPEARDVPYYVSSEGSPRNAQFSQHGGITQFGGSSNKSNMLHEMQHYVQDKEGFAKGANPNFGHPRADVEEAARIAYEKRRTSVPDEDDALLAELGVTVSRPTAPWADLTQRQRLEWYDAGRSRLYSNSAGEVEARTVQKRMDLTPEQRAQRPPWMDYDVPEGDQIVRGALADNARASAPGVVANSQPASADSALTDILRKYGLME